MSSVQINRVRRARQPAKPLEPVVDPAGWTKEEVASTRDWLYVLDAAEIADLDRMVSEIERAQRPLAEVGRDDVSMPVLAPTLKALGDELQDGLGFAVLRGIPVHRYTRLQSVIALWCLGVHFGIPQSQNAKGHLIGHVVEFGDANDPSGRLYYTSKILPFHCDGVVDIIGLLCLHPAKAGGESALVSSVSIYNEMLARRPDLVEALTGLIPRDRYREIPPGAAPYYEMPFFSFAEGYLSTSYHGFQGTTRPTPGVPPRTAQVNEAIALFESLCHELCFTTTFRQGDLQLLNNHVIVHSRISAVEDYPEPERKRHLLRLRLSTPGGRPLSPYYFAWEGVPPDQVRPGQRHSCAVMTPHTVLNIPLEPA